MPRRTGLHRLWSRVVHAWDAAQVELHGCYSVQRMTDLNHYIKHTTSTRTFFVIVLTPLPCLLAVAFADSIPLNDPREGMATSAGFWVRAGFATWVYTVSVLEQLRCVLPSLPLTGWTTLGLSIPIMTATIAVTYLLAWGVAYPLPFTIPIITCPWFVFMVSTLCLYLRTHIRENPDTTTDLLHFCYITCCQMTMLVIYPAYNAAFYHLSSTAQTLMVLFLPLIKLLEKNLLSFILRQVDDLRPEFITFNVEIFNALFVACCMQNSTSIITNIELVAIDFIMACISLRDLDQMLAEIHEIGAKAGIQPPQFKEAALLISQQHPRLERRVTERVRQERYGLRRQSALSNVGRGKPSLAKRGFLQRWLARFNENKTHPSSVQVGSSTGPAPIKAWEAAARSLDPISTETSSINTVKTSITSIAPFPLLKGSSAPDPHDSTGKAAATRPASMIDLMPEEDRIVFLQKALQILHLTEYMLLIEFTEVMIPIVYSLYLVVLFYLPNRAFYPQLKDMDSDKLHRTVANVMLNAICEFLSLIILAAVLRKKLNSSPFRHLAFVLDRQKRMVQSKLVLWVVITLQSTLYHLGADYSFNFEWLRHRRPEHRNT